MRTKGEIEAAIREEMSRFEQDYMGRVPEDIHVFLNDDLILIRLRAVLSVAEHNAAKLLPVEKGRDLLKLTRSHLLETARPLMEEMVEKVTGVKVVTMHHDISTFTGERIIASPSPRSPDFSEAK